MQKVVGIKIGNFPKTYFFHDNNLKLQTGDKVVVNTVQGEAIGTVTFETREVDDKRIVQPVEDVVRVATSRDLALEKELENKSKEALKVVKKHVKNLGLEMKIVSCNYAFDDSKIFIEFTAEERVDFRELLKVLAAELKTRIELRQIGQRDEVKCKGGIGPCGEICCCARFLNDFEHVTVKMAKNQGLSLSPTKISGLCGRLMCCLGYENAVYEEVLERMPKINSTVRCPSGTGTVVYNDLLKERVSVKIIQNDDNFSIIEYDLKDIQFNNKNKE